MMNEAWQPLCLKGSLMQMVTLVWQAIIQPSIFGDPLVGYANFKIFPNCIPPSSFGNSYSHSCIAINLSKSFKPPWNHWFFLNHFLTASTKHRSARSMAVDVPRSGRRTPCWRMCGVGETRELDSKSEGYLPQVE